MLGVLATFDTVMVVSADGDELSARPMAVKERGADGSLTFFTEAARALLKGTGPAPDLETHDRVTLAAE